MRLKLWYLVPALAISAGSFLDASPSTGTGLLVSLVTGPAFVLVGVVLYDQLADSVDALAMSERRWQVVAVLALPAAVVSAGAYVYAAVVLGVAALFVGGVVGRLWRLLPTTG